MKFFLLILFFAIYLLSFNQKEHFNPVDDVKKLFRKIKKIANDIKNLPKMIKKNVVDKPLKPIKQFINMIKNIRIESR